jgi:hypothetical protein
MTKDQALRLALEALKEDRAWLETDAPTEVWEKNNEAITSIKAALEAEDEPVQVSPLQFVEMVMEKEHLVGKPIFWAEWPNKEKNT